MPASIPEQLPTSFIYKYTIAIEAMWARRNKKRKRKKESWLAAVLLLLLSLFFCLSEGEEEGKTRDEFRKGSDEAEAVDRARPDRYLLLLLEEQHDLQEEKEKPVFGSTTTIVADAHHLFSKDGLSCLIRSAGLETWWAGPYAYLSLDFLRRKKKMKKSAGGKSNRELLDCLHICVNWHGMY